MVALILDYLYQQFIPSYMCSKRIIKQSQSINDRLLVCHISTTNFLFFFFFFVMSALLYTRTIIQSLSITIYYNTCYILVSHGSYAGVGWCYIK